MSQRNRSLPRTVNQPKVAKTKASKVGFKTSRRKPRAANLMGWTATNSYSLHQQPAAILHTGFKNRQTAKSDEPPGARRSLRKKEEGCKTGSRAARLDNDGFDLRFRLEHAEKIPSSPLRSPGRLRGRQRASEEVQPRPETRDTIP